MTDVLDHAVPALPPVGRLNIEFHHVKGVRRCAQMRIACQFQHAARWISTSPAKTTTKSKDNESIWGRKIPLPSHPVSPRNLDANLDTEETTFEDFDINQQTVFDVVEGELVELLISVYAEGEERIPQSETFVRVHDVCIGRASITVDLQRQNEPQSWTSKLESTSGSASSDPGELSLTYIFVPATQKVVGPENFDILKLIGRGTYGQVFQVRKKDSKQIYAMKVLSKKVIVRNMEVDYAVGERNILVRNTSAESPFLLRLKFAFQTPSDLYLVTDLYVTIHDINGLIERNADALTPYSLPGGELFWHLQKEGRFTESRTKFYVAEIILGLRHLHSNHIAYRDLKPENILLDIDGHVVLCDFGLSKANLKAGDTTNSIIGTTEYLAPEVLLDEKGYTTMVDFWSLGVLVFEMACGWSPFYADDVQQMYKNIAFGKVRFPRDALSPEGRSFVKGLLNRNPKHRLGAENGVQQLMDHPWFEDLDWTALQNKLILAPFVPKTGQSDKLIEQELDNASSLDALVDARVMAMAHGFAGSTPLSPTMQRQFQGFTFVDESALDQINEEYNAEEYSAEDYNAEYRGSELKDMDDWWSRPGDT